MHHARKSSRLNRRMPSLLQDDKHTLATMDCSGMTRWVSLGLTVITLIFLFPSFAGVSGDVAFTASNMQIGDCTIFRNYGLLSFKQWDSCEKGSYTITDYDSDLCNNENGELCGKCNSAGKGVLSFLVFSLFGVVSAFGLMVGKLFGANFSSFYSAGLLMGASFCTFIMWTVWAGGCDHYVKNKYHGKWIIDLGPAWALAFLSFIFTLTSGIIELMVGFGVISDGRAMNYQSAGDNQPSG